MTLTISSAQAASKGNVIDGNLLRAMQRYLARSAINSSSMRGAHKGTVKAARESLNRLDLHIFGTTDEAHFQCELDRTTEDLCQAIPGHEWGFARKGLNILLRRSLYNVYIRKQHRLDLSENHFEVPLDGIVARRIWTEANDLPHWRSISIKRLTPKTSALYQNAALEIAKVKGCSRVHLDAFWWGERE